MKKKVFIYEPLHEDAIKMMEPQCRLVRATAYDQPTLIREAAGSEAVIIRALGRVTAEVMDGCPDLKVVARQGVGVDNIDLAAARDRGARVVNSPHGNTRAMAEHFILLALGLARKLRDLESWLRGGDWQGLDTYAAVELSGRTLGILGFGNIGQTVARMCSAAFGMPVLYASRQAHEEAAREIGARRVDYEELFRQADVLAVCQALTPETKNLVDGKKLSLMKPEAFIINLSRGGVWNEDDLVKALKEKRLAGAASDVYQQEPLRPDHPLLGLDNFFGTPHSGALTAEAIRRIDLEVAEGVLDVLSGRTPKYIVV